MKRGTSGVEWNIIVEKGVTIKDGGHRYYTQLWEGFPKFDEKKSIDEPCFLVYNPKRNNAVLGRLGHKSLDAIKQNFKRDPQVYHLAFCRNLEDGKISVDHLKACSTDALETLILDVKYGVSMGGGCGF